MSKFGLNTITIFLSLLLFVPNVTAGQKGMGDATGIAQEAVKPAVVTLSGELTEIRIGPCEGLTGKSQIGTHLIVQTKDGNEINVHLGPVKAVDYVLDQVSVGQNMRFNAFRTKEMPEDDYITKSLTVDGKLIVLRDEDLRPIWAGIQEKDHSLRPDRHKRDDHKHGSHRHDRHEHGGCGYERSHSWCYD